MTDLDKRDKRAGQHLVLHPQLAQCRCISDDKERLKRKGQEKQDRSQISGRRKEGVRTFKGGKRTEYWAPVDEDTRATGAREGAGKEVRRRQERHIEYRNGNGLNECYDAKPNFSRNALASASTLAISVSYSPFSSKYWV